MSLKDYVYQFKGKIIVFIFIIFLGIGTSFAIKYYNNMMDDALLIEEVLNEDKKEVKVKETKAKEIKSDYFVDVKGMVNNPGVYGLSKESRVIDAIALAGGLKTDADTSLINLSMKVNDGMVILVYSKSEIKNLLATKEKEEQLASLCNQPIVNDACIEKAESETGLININTASLEQLTSLNGIGDAKAKAIIAYRETKAFTSIEEIMEVPGIGESLFAQISKSITV